jgi:large subunit ribosomal protein L28e
MAAMYTEANVKERRPLTCGFLQQEGYINDRAIGLHPTDKGISISTKNHSKHHQPAASSNTSTIGGSSRKSYRTIVNSTGNKGYRPDLRNAAVRRASALKAAQKPVKGDHPAKLRGAKAKKAAESS